MQNLKQKTKPVQIGLNYHKALKQHSAIKEKEMRDIVEEALDKVDGFSALLEKVIAR